MPAIDDTTHVPPALQKVRRFFVGAVVVAALGAPALYGAAVSAHAVGRAPITPDSHRLALAGISNSIRLS